MSNNLHHQTILDIQDISNTYGGKPLLQNVRFSLLSGEILCLLGPSGSGKTTLLRLIAGLEQDYSGKIIFDGRDIDPIPSHKRGFGMMFQEYALFPHKNVVENISFGLEMQNMPKTQRELQIDKMLELVGLTGFGNRKIDELSGGERQRVALARSLAPEPRLLLLDEPLGSLDRTLRERLTIEIRTILKQLGVTAIFVTHDQNEAFGVADKIAILQDGVLQQFASPEHLYRFPLNRKVARFLGFTNLLEGRLDRETGYFHSTVNDPGALPLFGPLGPVPRPDRVFTLPILLIRPEGARLLAKEEKNIAETLQLRGIVSNRRYQGSSYQIQLECQTGNQPLHLHFDLPLEPPPPPVGAPIELFIERSALVLLDGK
ncbi:ABC transporter ATP-binding protein [Desulforhopalus sp. IMCC35007]|uniref:ABC transporter ATP-binding protein n=1 Tax=Desulforhopalus sp. IMCC35007 TaxID=2569543 RepID=UPI0010AE34A8|nr:ABC transporter ATP-binding protein [Desulforhopalus sp. IMCC35007]TKB10691.1 ABC transporter ATP-binding protein [Desulforhopalus sp. IMCC35007]